MAARYRGFEPLALLLACGLCLGTIFPLGRIAQQQGISALTYIFTTAAGAGVVLAVLSWMTGQSLRPSKAAFRYAAISGQLTFAIPWGCVVVVLPKLGSALPAIIQCLTPMTTLALVYFLRLEKPNLLRITGLLIGFSGIVIVLILQNQQTNTESAALVWYAVALITPAVLAIGNVYRSTNWPQTTNHPLQLAAWSMFAASFSMFCLSLITRGISGALLNELISGWHFLLAQGLTTGAGFAFFFRLQLIGGPIYVSQLSYVNTAVGVGFAVILLAEVLSPWTYLALAFSFLGILIVNWAQTVQK